MYVLKRFHNITGEFLEPEYFEKKTAAIEAKSLLDPEESPLVGSIYKLDQCEHGMIEEQILNTVEDHIKILLRQAIWESFSKDHDLRDAIASETLDEKALKDYLEEGKKGSIASFYEGLVDEIYEYLLINPEELINEVDMRDLLHKLYEIIPMN